MPDYQKKKKQSKQNISSPTSPKVKKQGEWTKEEMEEAEPYPIPEVADEEEENSSSQRPYTNKLKYVFFSIG